jgi:hypothetical protein
VQIKGYLKRGSKFTLDAEKEIYAVKIHSHVAVGNARVAVFDEQSPKNKKWESGSIALAAGANTILISSGTPNSLTLPAADYGVWWQYDDVGDAPSYTAGAAGDGRYLAQAYGAFPSTISGDTSTAEKWTETIIIGGAIGEAHTTLESTSSGIAIVKAEWVGDASNPRCWNTIEISIHEAPDSPGSEDYDVWVQGQKLSELLIVNVVESGSECLATVETSDVVHTVEQGYDYTIYRRGTKIFMGRIEVVTKRIDPDMVTRFQGRSFIQTLLWIPIATATYTAQTLKTMIESVISTYVDPLKQVSQGTISSHLDDITATVEDTDTTAFDLLQRIARLGGASLFVNKDREVNII